VSILHNSNEEIVRYTTELRWCRHFGSQQNRPDKWNVRIKESNLIDLRIVCFPEISSAWWSIRINGTQINKAPLYYFKISLIFTVIKQK
jgi:hypothetical protein